MRRRRPDARLPRFARVARSMVALALAYAVATCAAAPLPTAQALAGVVTVRVAAKAWRRTPAAPVDRVEALQVAPTKARTAAPFARGAAPAMLVPGAPPVASAVLLGQLSVSIAAPPSARAPVVALHARGPPRAPARHDRPCSRG